MLIYVMDYFDHLSLPQLVTGQVNRKPGVASGEVGGVGAQGAGSKHCCSGSEVMRPNIEAACVSLQTLQGLKARQYLSSRSFMDFEGKHLLSPLVDTSHGHETIESI